MATVAACGGINTPTSPTIPESTATSERISATTSNTATLAPTNQTDAKNAQVPAGETQKSIHRMTEVAQAPTREAMETETFIAEKTVYASHVATRIAYDTAVPLPTAEPLRITASEGLTATARQAGISLQVDLPKTTFRQANLWTRKFACKTTARNRSRIPIGQHRLWFLSLMNADTGLSQVLGTS